MPLNIRRAMARDAAAIARLHADSWRTAYRGILSDDYLDGGIDAERQAHWSERFAAPPDDRLFVALAEQDREPVAFVCAQLDEDPAWGALLDNLHVVPALKRSGIGTRLMGEAAAWIVQQRPSSRMHLWVYEQNRPARRFYERLGGAAIARAPRAASDGSAVEAVKYGWDDVRRLASIAQTP